MVEILSLAVIVAMSRSKDQKCKELVSVLHARRPGDTIAAAKEGAQLFNNWITIISVGGPVLLSVLLAIFPWETTWKKANNYIAIFTTLSLIASLIFLINKSSLYNRAVSFIERSQEYQQQQIDALQRKIDTLQRDKSYYVSVAEQIGIAIKNDKKDLLSLARVAVASLYDYLTKILHGDNVTINLYELKNNQFRMLQSFTHLKYLEKKENLDNPLLFKADAGIDLKSPEIQSYYCVRCLKGRVKGHDGRFVLPDWVTIATEFQWQKWDEAEKESIINSHDREKCLEIGFKYNQYIGFKWKRVDGIVGFLEIITNDETVLDEHENINKVGRQIQEACIPFVNIIWDIATD